MDAAGVLEVLALARALVEAGWLQGRASERTLRDERYCALGALNCAMLTLDAPLIAHQVMARTCYALHGVHVIVFNDRPGTTKRQVLALFDEAAARVGGK